MKNPHWRTWLNVAIGCSSAGVTLNVSGFVLGSTIVMWAGFGIAVLAFVICMTVARPI